jgi:hypothetical protein
MQYLTNTLDVLEHDQEKLKHITVTSISIDDVKKKLLSNNEFETLVSDEQGANIISQTLNLNNLIYNQNHKDITPFDTLLVLEPNKINPIRNFTKEDISCKMVELNAVWRVDYYSRDKKLLKQVTLGKLSYSEARREAYLAGTRVPYDLFDIYYINKSN